MTDLTPYLNRLDFLNDTANQIIKDFGMSGLEIKFSGNADNAYAELFLQIHPHIEKLMKGSTGNFYNLLYRIDLSENQIKKAVESSLDKSISETLTDLILKRELLKVVMRNFYKKQ
ncbi:MAG: hypothetical protein HY840_10375 [Bacteroidetes bacterium]|nr:hypothetical protein [Bacteroidota bacterium]